MKRLPSSELPKANAHRPPLQRFFQSLMSSSEGDYEIGIARGSVAAVSDACSATLRERRYRGLVFRRGDGAGLDCFLALRLFGWPFLRPSVPVAVADACLAGNL